MDTEPSRARVALTGALHGLAATVACAVLLSIVAVVVMQGAKGLTAPAIFALVLVIAYLRFGIWLLLLAIGIGALAGTLGRPERAARRAWLTVVPLTVLYPVSVWFLLTAQAH